MNNFVTNTATKLLPNRFGCQISEVYNGGNLAGAYVGICENHTGQIDLYNGGNLANFGQINLAHQVAPLFVLLILDVSFLQYHTAHTAQALTWLPPFLPDAIYSSCGCKEWGQADKDLLNNLINRQLINITDTSLDNIKQVRAAHFWHCNKRNFRRNFRDFAAA